MNRRHDDLCCWTAFSAGVLVGVLMAAMATGVV